MPAIRYWKPGREYTTAIPGRSWWKPDGERAIIAVALVWPKGIPAWDGSEWTEWEIWTVRLPLRPGDTINPAPGDAYGSGAEYMLHDKPHRVTWWAEDEPSREVIDRLPVPLLDGVRLTDPGLIWHQTATDRRAWRQWQAAQLRHDLRTAVVRRRTRNGRRRLDERDEAWRGYRRYWEGWRRERHVLEEAR